MKALLKFIAFVFVIVQLVMTFSDNGFDFEENLPLIFLVVIVVIIILALGSKPEEKPEKKSYTQEPAKRNLNQNSISSKKHNFGIPDIRLSDYYPYNEFLENCIFDCNTLYFNIIRNGKLLFHYNKELKKIEITEHSKLKNLLKEMDAVANDNNTKRTFATNKNIVKNVIKEPYHKKLKKDNNTPKLKSEEIDSTNILRLNYSLLLENKKWIYSYKAEKLNDGAEIHLLSIPVGQVEYGENGKPNANEQEKVYYTGLQIAKIMSYELQKIFSAHNYLA